MVNILLFHKGIGVALVRCGSNYSTLSYINFKKKVISLPVKIVFATFLDNHSGALLVASERPVLISSVIQAYHSLTETNKFISYKSIGKLIHELERSSRKKDGNNRKS